MAIASEVSTNQASRIIQGTIMKDVAVVYSCLLLCLWTNVGTATSELLEPVLEDLCPSASETENPELMVIFYLNGSPSLEELKMVYSKGFSIIHELFHRKSESKFSELLNGYL